MLLYQHLRAPNDRNGNPRRLYVFYKTDEDGDTQGYASLVRVHDEGYAGRPLHLLEGAIELPSVGISASEYRDWLGWAP